VGIRTMKPMKIMLIALLTGFLTGGYGLYLLLFTTRIDDGGLADIFLVVGLLTVGVFLLVPAKIYIIIQLTTHERNKRKNKE